MSEKFVHLHEVSSKGGTKILRGLAGSVIKKNHVNKGGTARKIIHRSAKPSVEAIIEKDIVTGVRVKCACGEVTEVYFQYEQTP